ncbi:MAG: beta-propeller fold lactonase family protein [Streptosporangiales bacterium]|nr:beta-propeller fold lactonase family protein [Streptosporangiales bacterium]
MNGRSRLVAAAIVGLTTAATLAMSFPGAATDDAPPGGRIVYVTNSGTPNVTHFAINNTGTLTRVSSVEAGGGARGMAFTPDLRFAYVSGTTADRVDMYRIGPNGVLTRFGAIETPSPVGIEVALNGRMAYVGNGGNRTISIFTIRPDGALTLREVVDSGAAVPKGIAVTPDGHFLYVSHGRPSDTGPSVITGFAIEPDGTPGRRVAKADIGISGAETVITPNGRFVYVVHQVSNDVYGFRVGRDGSLTPVPNSPVAAGDGPEGAAISPDGRRLYVTAVGVEDRDPSPPGQVLGFTIGRDGRLTETVDRVDMASPIGIGFAPNGRRMYVSDYTDSIVNTFTVAPDGNLTLVQTLGSGGRQPAFQSLSVLPTRSGRTSG